MSTQVAQVVIDNTYSYQQNLSQFSSMLSVSTLCGVFREKGSHAELKAHVYRQLQLAIQQTGICYDTLHLPWLDAGWIYNEKNSVHST